MNNFEQQTNNELARTLGRIEATLEKFDETLVRFDHQLFGNGQPGKLTILDKRVDDLEETHSRVKGAIATLAAFVTAIGGTGLYHLLFGRR